MENEACDLLKKTQLKKDTPYQLFTPHIHLRNAAERSIQNFKDNFIASLCSTEPKYPAQELDRLIPQVTMTFNMLRKSRTNPKLFPYAAIFDIHNFNRCPL